MGTIANAFIISFLFLAGLPSAFAQDHVSQAQGKLNDNVTKTTDALDIKAMLDEEVALKGVLFNMVTVHMTAPSVPLSEYSGADPQHPEGWTTAETRMNDLQSRLVLHKMNATDQICGKGSAQDKSCADGVKEVMTKLLKRIDAMSPEELKAYRLTVVQDQDKATAVIAKQQKTVNRLVAGRGAILGQLLQDVTVDAVMTSASTGALVTRAAGVYGTSNEGTAIKAGVLASASVKSGSHIAIHQEVVDEQVETGFGGGADVYHDEQPNPTNQ